jgi:hypothetical protein
MHLGGAMRLNGAMYGRDEGAHTRLKRRANVMKQSARGFLGIGMLLVGCAQPEPTAFDVKAQSSQLGVFPIQTRLPEPGIRTLYLRPDGGISMVEFRDGRTLEAPTLESNKEKLNNIDLVEYYHLPFDLIVLRASQETAQRLFPKMFDDRREIVPAISPRELLPYPDILIFCKKLGSTACWGHLVSEGDGGDVIIRFGPDWSIQEVELPNGTIETEPIVDLSEEDIEGVDLVGHLSYRLLVYRDRSRPEEEIQRILLPAVIDIDAQ